VGIIAGFSPATWFAFADLIALAISAAEDLSEAVRLAKVERGDEHLSQ